MCLPATLASFALYCAIIVHLSSFTNPPSHWLVTLGVLQRLLTLIFHRDTDGSRIVLQMGGVCTTLRQDEGMLCKSIAIGMGGVSRYFSKVLGSWGRFDSPDLLGTQGHSYQWLNDNGCPSLLPPCPPTFAWCQS